MTPYEFRIAKLRCSGLTLREISKITEKSYGTTRIDFHKLYRKLGMKVGQNESETVRELREKVEEEIELRGREGI